MSVSDMRAGRFRVSLTLIRATIALAKRVAAA
jgi:hypothetical protein